MTLEDKVHAFRLHVLQRAEELSNVSAACREAGISRTLFYRWRNKFTRTTKDAPPCRRGGIREVSAGLDVQLRPEGCWS